MPAQTVEHFNPEVKGIFAQSTTACPMYRAYALDMDDLKRRAQASPHLSDSYGLIIAEFRRAAYRHAKHCSACLAETSGGAA